MRKRAAKPKPGASQVQGKNKGLKESPASSKWWFWLTFCALAGTAIYFVGPFLLTTFPLIIKHLVHSHRLRVPFIVDLGRPEELSLNHTINMYLSSEQGVSLGVWHTVPESKWKEAQGKDLDWYQSSLGDGSPIFMYLHGNTGSRAAPHRVGVANILSALGYHALVMDYRGFADSTGTPTEAGLTTDALYLYRWVKARSGNSLVVMWGHSLGTGVSTNTAVELMKQGVVVDGVIIEGAFPHIPRERGLHPLRWLYADFPSFGAFVTDPNLDRDIVLPNDENLKKMRSPLLILHSEDDHLAPIHMARQLYEISRSTQDPDRVRMAVFEGSLGYLHNGLYRDPRLPGIIQQFVESL